MLAYECELRRLRSGRVAHRLSDYNRHIAYDQCLFMYFYHYKSSAVVFGYLKKCFLYFYFVFFIFVYNMFHCVLSCVRCVVRTSEKVCKVTTKIAFMQIFTLFFLFFYTFRKLYIAFVTHESYTFAGLFSN